MSEGNPNDRIKVHNNMFKRSKIQRTRDNISCTGPPNTGLTVTLVTVTHHRAHYDFAQKGERAKKYYKFAEPTISIMT